MTTGERIKTARTNAGLSLRQLAKMLECSHAAISDWEAGNRRPSDLWLNTIADYCDVSFEWLANGRLTAIAERTLNQLQALPADEREKVIGLLETLRTEEKT